MPLPTYPFERQRYWIDVAKPALGAPREERRLATDLSDWFHLPGWKRSDRFPTVIDEELAAGPWLIFADGQGLGDRLAERLARAGAVCAVVRPGTGFARLEEGEETRIEYRIEAGREEDYGALLADLAVRGRAPRRIAHLWGLDESADDERALGHGFFSLVHLGRALAGQSGPAALTAVTGGAFEVTGEEELHPARAAALGLCRSLPAEIPGLTARLIDLADPSRVAGNARLLDRLLGDLLEEEPEETVLAWRGSYRWAQVFEPVRLTASAAATPLREGGVYVLSGENGLAREIAEHLAGRFRAQLVRIEEPGASAMREAREQALARFGRIDAVIHAANAAGETAGAGLLERLRTVRWLGEVFPSEVMGLVSTAAAHLTRPGRAVQAAEGAFLGAFAHERAARGAATVAVEWDTWEEAGVARGLEALERVLGGEWPQVIVSRRDFQARVRDQAADSRRTELPETPARPSHARPALATAFEPPGSETERAVAALWRDLLGVSSVGARDDFFELGGDSLVGIQLTAALRRTFGVDLPLREVFEVPRVVDMAARVEALLGRAGVEGGEAPPVLPIPRDGDLPLSFGQERLWFLDRLETGTAFYNEASALRLNGRLSPGALERALREVERRHEALRARFPEADGRPVLCIAPAPALTLPVVDLAALPEGAREPEARRLALAQRGAAVRPRPRPAAARHPAAPGRRGHGSCW